MTIPASAIAQVTPGVVSAGGSALVLNGVVLTTNTRVPIGSILPFSSLVAVQNYFGALSTEASVAANYYSGYTNSTIKPALMYFVQYVWQTPVAAYLRGGSIAATTLTQLQALSGVLTVTVDGVAKTSSTINLSAATSFSNAAALIQAGFATNPPTVTFDSQSSAFVLTSPTTGAGAAFTGAIATTTLTVSAITSGALQVGSVISGVGVTAGTYITALGTGTGGIGTYTISTSQNVSSESMTANASSMTFATGTLSTSLNLTQATSAVLSQGAALSTPATAMPAITAVTQNWAAFMTTFEPVLADKLAFSAWTNSQNNRYAYVAWDTDVNAIVANNTTAFGPQLIANGSSGTVAISGDPAAATAANTTLAALNLAIAGFFLGSVASINFGQQNGRITFAFKSQAGIVPNCTNQTTGAILIANGYNFYGAYATANQQFQFFNPGSISGIFQWADEYINQIWLNSQFQLALMTLVTGVGSIPYNAQGYALISAALQDPINQALNFGAIRSGVTLSALEIANANNAAGLAIDKTLSSRGWYLQVLDPGAQARGARTTPSCTFWYTDGGSVQQINLASIDVQ